MENKTVDRLSEYGYEPEKATEVIPLDIEDGVFLHMAKMAHERDITINHLMNAIIFFEIEDRDTNDVADSVIAALDEKDA